MTPRFPFSLAQSPAQSRTIYERIASIEQAPEPGDAKKGRRYKAVMMTGEVITDFHTGVTRYAHQLDRNGTIHLDRMNSGRAPVVDNHSMWGSGGESVLGIVEQGSVHMAAEGLVGTIRFQPDDQLPEGIRNGLSSGVLQNLSIQVTVLGMERIESDGLILAKVTEYDPFEVSVVPVGADSGAHMLRIAQSIHGFFDHHADGGTGAGGGAPAAGQSVAGVVSTVLPAAAVPDADTIRAEERARVTGIQSICQSIGLDPQSFIDGGQTVDEVKTSIRQQLPGGGDVRRGAPLRLQLETSAPPAPIDARSITLAERARGAAIREICQSPLAGGADPQPFIDGGQSVDQVRSELWNRGGPGSDVDPGAGGGTHQAPHTPAGGSAQEKMIVGIQHSFLERGDADGIVAKHEKLTIDASEFRGISLAEAGGLLIGRPRHEIGYGREAVAQSILRHSEAFRQALGIPGFLGARAGATDVLGAQGSLRQSFGGIGGDLLGAQGRSDLSVVIENLMHRTLSAAYAMQAEVSAWTSCCTVKMASDFRPQNHVFLGALPDFGTRSDTGDFPRAQVPNPEKATTQVTERGQTIVISRTTIIDDDLGVVFQTPRLQGMTAQRMIEHMFFALLAQNSGLGPNVAVSGTSRSLFHSDHNNIGTGDALDAAAVNADRTLMARQTMVGSDAAKDQSVGGFDLFADCVLDTYLVPTELTSGLMIIRDSEKEPGTDNQNTQRGSFKKIVGTPRLTGTRRYGFSTGAMGGINQSADLRFVLRPAGAVHVHG